MPMQPRGRSGLPVWAGACGLLLLSGCATNALKLAPPSAEVPWEIPAAPLAQPGADSIRGGSEAAAAARPDPALPADVPVKPEAGKHYGLPELIDLAQRSSPDTREAWETARQAALAVGLTESAYVPQLTADIVGGFQSTPVPIPTSVVAKGYFIADSREVLPTIALKWLLFDFGRRSGAERAARENSFVANVAFTGAHQKLVFAVSRDYYALGASRGKRQAAEQAVKTAEFVESAVEARRRNGLATTVELAQARRQTAQARFNLERAIGGEHVSYESLINSLGSDPMVHLEVDDDVDAPLPPAGTNTVEQYVQQALATRPDVIAAMGKVRAAQASLDKEHAEHYPTIALAGQAYQNIGDVRTEDSPYYSVNKPGGDILLTLSVPLFDGGQRDAQIAVARSELAGAQSAYDATRDNAIKQVRDASDAVNTSLSEYAAAKTLLDSSQVAYDAALDAYQHGVETYTNVVNEETALAQAQADAATAHADAQTAACALAFAAGSILRSTQVQ